MQKQDSNTAVKVELMQYKKRLERDDKEEQTKVEGKIEKMMDIYSQLLNKVSIHLALEIVHLDVYRNRFEII